MLFSELPLSVLILPHSHACRIDAKDGEHIQDLIEVLANLPSMGVSERFLSACVASPVLRMPVIEYFLRNQMLERELGVFAVELVSDVYDASPIHLDSNVSAGIILLP